MANKQAFEAHRVARNTRQAVATPAGVDQESEVLCILIWAPFVILVLMGFEDIVGVLLLTCK